jgi:DNA-directed RNA polymerase subunit F
MIIERTPLTLNEVEEIVNEIPDNPKKEEVLQFSKKFLKTDSEQSKKMRKELEELDMIKMKREHIIKVIDLLPLDASDINKIFVDVTLNEDETNKILEIVKKNSK